jgi:hypothetical protein
MRAEGRKSFIRLFVALRFRKKCFSIVFVLGEFAPERPETKLRFLF